MNTVLRCPPPYTYLPVIFKRVTTESFCKEEWWEAYGYSLLLLGANFNEPRTVHEKVMQLHFVLCLA